MDAITLLEKDHENVRHHVEEEEGDDVPPVRSATDGARQTASTARSSARKTATTAKRAAS